MGARMALLLHLDRQVSTRFPHVSLIPPAAAGTTLCPLAATLLCLRRVARAVRAGAGPSVCRKEGDAGSEAAAANDDGAEGGGVLRAHATRHAVRGELEMW